jgi:hypothetical protein
MQRDTTMARSGSKGCTSKSYEQKIVKNKRRSIYCSNYDGGSYRHTHGLNSCSALVKSVVELYNVSKTPRCFGGTTATVYTVPTTANIDGV